jgi:Rrf2 family transcriptional repressor of oqxAB
MTLLKLLRSKMGKTGGVRLARPAGEITLRDIYGAVVADSKIWPPRTGGSRECETSGSQPQPPVKAQDQRRLA